MAAMILPMLAGDRPPCAGIGTALSYAPAPGEEFTRPLLGADPAEQLTRTFERASPQFRDYYLSAMLLLWGSLREDALRFSLRHQIRVLDRRKPIHKIGELAAERLAGSKYQSH